MLFNSVFIQEISTFELAVLLALWGWLGAAAGAAFIRKKRTERELQVQITNQGNVESGYQLRVEEPSGAMQVRFYYNRKRLPLLILHGGDQASQPALAFASASNAPEVPAVPAPKKSVPDLSIAGSLASMLTSVGSMLPAKVGRPFLQAGSKIYSGQIKAGYTTGKVKRIKSYVPSVSFSSPSSSSPSSHSAEMAPVTHSGVAWVETPAIKPGETLKLHVLLRPAWSSQDQISPFQLLSYSGQASAPEPVMLEDKVQTKGGFLSHALYPQLLLFGLEAAVLLALFWLRSAGQLF
jgi:hypothetical protein